jgi:hypothetical protein
MLPNSRHPATAAVSRANSLTQTFSIQMGPHKFPIPSTFGRNAGKGAGNWNNPLTAQVEAVSVTLTFLKSATRPEGKYYIFFGDAFSDQAG